MRDRLERADWAAELLPLLGISDAHLEAAGSTSRLFRREADERTVGGRRDRLGRVALLAHAARRAAIEFHGRELPRQIQCVDRLRLNAGIDCEKGRAVGDKKQIGDMTVENWRTGTVERGGRYRRAGGDAGQQVAARGLIAGAEEDVHRERRRGEVRPRIERPAHLLEYNVRFHGSLTEALIALGHQQRLEADLLGHPSPRRAVEAFGRLHHRANRRHVR